MNDNHLIFNNVTPNKRALEWLTDYTTSIDSYSALCVALLAWLFMTNVDLNISKYVTGYASNNYCLNELITFHCIIFLFSMLHGLDVHQKLKKVETFSISDLKAYILESVEIRDLFSNQLVKRKKRLTVLIFIILVLIVAIPIQVFLWHGYVTQCITDKPLYQVDGLLGLLFYACLLVRLPFYLLVIFKSRA
jgi:hypothetical protein